MPICRHSPGLARRRGIHVAALATLAVPAGASAAHVAAGTVISNTATATYDTGAGTTRTVSSNAASLKVDELLDVAVATRGDPVQVSPGDTGKILSFTVTNAGNGPEAFKLEANGALGGDDFDPTITGLAIDANGNGQYDPGVDTTVAQDGATAILNPDTSAVVFVIASIPKSATDKQRGAAGLTATALSGSGKPGTVFAGKGEGGGDAVVGATTASANAANDYVVGTATATIVQRSALSDPFGGSQALHGSIITYYLDTKVTGSATLPAAQVADSYPEGATYEPGSLALDGKPLSDQDDSDAGSASTTGIIVKLGDITGATPHTVSFKCKIK